MSQAIAISSRSPGRLGTRVCGFQIVEQISEHTGTGATVYRAHDDKRDVAVKIYERTEARPIDPRALVESAAQGLVQHPAVAKLIDATLLADGSYCLVSDWIHGVPLTAVIAEAPSWERVRKIVESINAGLSAIHAAGVIHRGLSPDNILAPRAQSPATVIIDFSSAIVLDGVRAARAPSASASGPGASPYTSPEQLAGLPLDARADLYALGVVLYELLTGAKPEGHTHTHAHAAAAVDADVGVDTSTKADAVADLAVSITPPRTRAPLRDIPVVAEELCMWLLAKDRDARVPSSRVLAVTLGAVAADMNGGQL